MIFEREGSRARSRSQALGARRGIVNPEACGTLLLQYILNYLCHRASLGSRPPPFRARFNYA